MITLVGGVLGEVEQLSKKVKREKELMDTEEWDGWRWKRVQGV